MRSNLVQTAAVSGVTLAALALLCVVLAYWSWEWLGPRAKPGALPMLQPVAGIAHAQTLFAGPRDGESLTTAERGIRLLGVVAANGREPGYAVVEVEPRRGLAVREGEDIFPGVRLAEVHPDHVVIDRRGARETLSWPKKKGKR